MPPMRFLDLPLDTLLEILDSLHPLNDRRALLSLCVVFPCLLPHIQKVLLRVLVLNTDQNLKAIHAAVSKFPHAVRHLYINDFHNGQTWSRQSKQFRSLLGMCTRITNVSYRILDEPTSSWPGIRSPLCQGKLFEPSIHVFETSLLLRCTNLESVHTVTIHESCYKRTTLLPRFLNSFPNLSTLIIEKLLFTTQYSWDPPIFSLHTLSISHCHGEEVLEWLKPAATRLVHLIIVKPMKLDMYWRGKYPEFSNLDDLIDFITFVGPTITRLTLVMEPTVGDRAKLRGFLELFLLTRNVEYLTITGLQMGSYELVKEIKDFVLTYGRFLPSLNQLSIGKHILGPADIYSDDAWNAILPERPRGELLLDSSLQLYYPEIYSHLRESGADLHSE